MYGKFEGEDKYMLNMKLIVVVLEQLLEKGNDRQQDSANDMVLQNKAKKYS